MLERIERTVYWVGPVIICSTRPRGVDQDTLDRRLDLVDRALWLQAQAGLSTGYVA